MKSQIIKGILIIIGIILLILPIFYFVNQNQTEKEYEQLLEIIETATSKYAKGYATQGSSFKVKLGDLKDKNLLSLNVKNPKTGAHLSNETYVVANYVNGAYSYDIHLYDIPEKEDRLDLIMSLVGDKSMQNGISVRYEEQGLNVSDGQKNISYSTQYFYKDEEIYTIDSSRPKTFTVVYTALNSNGEIAKVTRTVVVQ